jgi:hypothetical protein
MMHTHEGVVSSHLIVTRFAVPYEDPARGSLYRDPAWLAGRLELFRRFFAPSVAPLGVPALLLCGEAAAERVARAVEDLSWARVEVQDDWNAGWDGEPGQTLTRLDSDDALHQEWFEALDRCPPEAEVVVTRSFLRFDRASGGIHRYRRREPSPLAAFRDGANPYRVDHKFLDDHYRTHEVREPYLLQVIHGDNLANRRLRRWRLDRRVPRRVLREFGLGPELGPPAVC